MNIKKWNIKKIEIKNVLSSQYLKKNKKKNRDITKEWKKKKEKSYVIVIAICQNFFI